MHIQKHEMSYNYYHAENNTNQLKIDKQLQKDN